MAKVELILKDGSVREVEAGTTALEVAQSISRGLGKAALVAKLDGAVIDLMYKLDKGGKILVALYKDEPVGVCALIKMNDPDYDYELAKMAVSPKAQGKSIGWLLGEAIKKTAKELGASKIYLESNTSLAPAINLYYKLGFQKITGRPTPYQRANIQMELNLK